MNIEDFKAKAIEGDMLLSIFEHQIELHEKYRSVELKNGLGLAVVEGRGEFDIDDKYWQCVLKDFSHRVIEEVIESLEATMFSTRTPNEDAIQKHLLHAKEESIDALHFLTEYFIIAEISPIEIARADYHSDADLLETVCRTLKPKSNVCDSYLQVIYDLGVATNLLKMRPWKTTHVITDRTRFNSHLIDAYRSLLSLMLSLGMQPTEIYAMYTQKNQVNHWRMGTNY